MYVDSKKHRFFTYILLFYIWLFFFYSYFVTFFLMIKVYKTYVDRDAQMCSCCFSFYERKVFCNLFQYVKNKLCALAALNK